MRTTTARPISNRRRMRRRTWRIGAAAASTALACAALLAAGLVGGTPGVSAAAPTSVVPRLSALQLAGQRVVYAYTGLTPPRSLLARIRAGEAAGVIFFSSNIAGVSQLHTVIAELQRANAGSPVHAPLLMVIDQEGGLVRRLPGPPVLSQKTIGASPAALALAGAAGADAGRSLRAAGINVDLAPVLDVAYARGNFIDRYERSYGSDPAAIGRLATAFTTSLQRTGVSATAKHFPGLGAAARYDDTDRRAVTLRTALSRLRSVDEAPYRSAIAGGARLVMLSWATYPALDPRLPAGLSPIVIGGELRGRLGFRGVTITDAIGAGALSRFGGVGQRAVLAARAGDDLILTSASVAEGESVATRLAAALTDHVLGRGAALAAVTRIVELRSRWGR